MEYRRWLINNPNASLNDRQIATTLYYQNVSVAQSVMQNLENLPSDLPDAQLSAIKDLFPNLETMAIPNE